MDLIAAGPEQIPLIRSFEGRPGHRGRVGAWSAAEHAGRGRRRALAAVMRWCFREDGLMRETVFLDGVWHSQYLMAILDREYDAQV